MELDKSHSGQSPFVSAPRRSKRSSLTIRHRCASSDPRCALDGNDSSSDDAWPAYETAGYRSLDSSTAAVIGPGNRPLSDGLFKYSYDDNGNSTKLVLISGGSDEIGPLPSRHSRFDYPFAFRVRALRAADIPQRLGTSLPRPSRRGSMSECLEWRSRCYHVNSAIPLVRFCATARQIALLRLWS